MAQIFLREMVCSKTVFDVTNIFEKVLLLFLETEWQTDICYGQLLNQSPKCLYSEKRTEFGL